MRWLKLITIKTTLITIKTKHEVATQAQFAMQRIAPIARNKKIN
jgi:hypothetical protein